MHCGREEWYVDVFDGTVIEKPKYNVNEIPPDYLLRILSLLSFEEKTSARLVSRMWKMCLDYMFKNQSELSVGGRFVCNRDNKTPDKNPLERMVECRHQFDDRSTIGVNCYRALALHVSFTSFLKKWLPNVTVLQLGGTQHTIGTESAVKLIAAMSSNLICLDCPYYMISAGDAQPALPKLRHLVCQRIRHEDLWTLCPRLEAVTCYGMRQDAFQTTPARIQHLDCEPGPFYYGHASDGLTWTGVREMRELMRAEVGQTIKSLSVTDRSTYHNEDADNRIPFEKTDMFPMLQAFKYMSQHSLTPLRPLTQSSKLQRLELHLGGRHLELVDDLRSLFTRLNNLQTLVLHLGCRVTDDLFQMIALNLTSLKKIEFINSSGNNNGYYGYGYGFGADAEGGQRKLTPEYLFHLSRMTGLQVVSLSVSGVNLTHDDVINFLRGFSRETLTFLYLKAPLTASPGITPSEELKVMRRRHVLRKAFLNDAEVV